MTDDLVARLRHEGDDEAVEALRFQEANIRRLERKLATAEARVRELEAMLAETQGQRRQWQEASVRDRAALAEAYERAAKVAEEMPNMIAIGPKHVRGLRGSDVAAAIRSGGGE